ncbi:uncharacterized protein [Lolium perenne]|uniref:uncharacterized protein isoform X1 n=2 Tax=Lolium perenne TaxID=4522 RepID=UPI0021F68355|nr:uncharacterized protein LOC127296700 isoform X2 [Lolium perenne]
MAYLKPTTEEASSDPLFNMGRRLRNLTAGDQRFFAGSRFLMRLPLWFSNARRLKTSAAAKSRRSLWASLYATTSESAGPEEQTFPDKKSDMGTGIQIWSTAKTLATGAVIGLTISDRYLTIVTTKGDSMHPTLTAADSFFRGDVVFAERGCLDKYKFSRGDVVIFKCPSDHKRDFVKRLIALPGEWIRIPVSQEIIKVPAGHCWVEGDNADRSWDSRSFGPIPLGLIKGRVTHIIWPPSKMGRVERKWPEGRVSPF